MIYIVNYLAYLVVFVTLFMCVLACMACLLVFQQTSHLGMCGSCVPSIQAGPSKPAITSKMESDTMSVRFIQPLFKVVDHSLQFFVLSSLFIGYHTILCTCLHFNKQLLHTTYILFLQFHTLHSPNLPDLKTTFIHHPSTIQEHLGNNPISMWNPPFPLHLYSKLSLSLS